MKTKHKGKRRDPEFGEAMHEIGRQTTEQTHRERRTDIPRKAKYKQKYYGDED